MAFVIAVHAGAGYHDPKAEEEYARAMKRACQRGAEVLKSTACVLRTVEAAISVLEDEEVCNAGRGSNLTREGGVECDASAMEGGGSFGAVGAAPGIRNPIKAAVQLALDGRERLSCGRVRPMLLAGQGATRWARFRGLDATMDTKEAEAMHVTPKARQRWARYRQMVNRAVDSESELSEDESQKKRQKWNPFYDTVGCVVIDGQGRVAAGASSGGIAFKFSGRVGEAAPYGAGCWAQEWSSPLELGVAVSVSGMGERIMRSFVAEKCAAAEKEYRCEKGTRCGTFSVVCQASKAAVASQDYPEYPQEIGVLCAVRWKECCDANTLEKTGKQKVHVQLKACTSPTTRSMAVGWLTSCGEGDPCVVNTRILRQEGGSIEDGRTLDEKKAMEWLLVDDFAWSILPEEQ